MFTLCCQHYCQQHGGNLIHVTPCLHFVVSITASSTIAVWYTSHHVYTLLSALLPAARWQSDTRHTMFTLCCQHYCQQHDSNLIHVNNEEENTFIRNYIKEFVALHGQSKRRFIPYIQNLFVVKCYVTIVYPYTLFTFNYAALYMTNMTDGQINLRYISWSMIFKLCFN